MTRPFAAVEKRLRTLGFGDAAINETLAAARAHLESPPRILFMGGFNAGKSSVVNALVGAPESTPVAPVGAIPTTALVTHVRFGEVHRVCCVLHSGAREWSEPRDYQRLVDQSATDTASAARRGSIAHVEVFYPAEVLRRATLVDSPGLGSLDPRDDQTTLAHLRLADAICWVFDIEPGPQAPLVETIRRLAPQMPLAWGLLNKADLKTPTDRLQVQESFDSTVGRHFRRLKLFSAKQALEAAGGRPVHRDDAAGVRLDVVEQILDALGERPPKAKAERTAEAVLLARDAALHRIGARWRGVVTDIEAISRFGTRGRTYPALDVFDAEIDNLSRAASLSLRPDLLYQSTREALIKKVRAAPSPLVEQGSIPAGFLSPTAAQDVDERMPVSQEDAQRLSSKLYEVLPSDPRRFTSDVPRHARLALKTTLDSTPMNANRSAFAKALEDAARDLQSMTTTD